MTDKELQITALLMFIERLQPLHLAIIREVQKAHLKVNQSTDDWRLLGQAEAYNVVVSAVKKLIEDIKSGPDPVPLSVVLEDVAEDKRWDAADGRAEAFPNDASDPDDRGIV